MAKFIPWHLPKYKTPESMQKKIMEYFDNPPTKEKRYGEMTIDLPVITISGLSKYLGFASRQSFYDYEKKDDFSYTIKRARLFVEVDYEESLRTGQNTAGDIFGLKNLGWADKQEVEQTTTHKGIIEVPAVASVADWERMGQESLDRIRKEHEKLDSE